MDNFLVLAQVGTFTIIGLVYLVIEILAVGFVCWLLIWAIDQFGPASPAPFAVLIKALRVLIIVIGALIILFLLLRFIGIPM